MNITKSFSIVAAAIIFISACSQSPNTPNKAYAPTNTVNKTAEITTAQSSEPVSELAMGKELYSINCMICHKDNGKGGKVTIQGKTMNADDLTSEKMKKHDDAKLYGHISDGVPDEGMPAFKDKLTDTEIKEVVKHLRMLQSS